MWAYIVPAAAAVVVAIIEAIAAKERRATKADREWREIYLAMLSTALTYHKRGRNQDLA